MEKAQLLQTHPIDPGVLYFGVFLFMDYESMRKVVNHLNETSGEPLVYRSIGIPVSAFDYLKAFQRLRNVQLLKHLTNSEALALLILEHRNMNEESGVQNARTDNSY